MMRRVALRQPWARSPQTARLFSSYKDESCCVSPPTPKPVHPAMVAVKYAGRYTGLATLCLTCFGSFAFASLHTFYYIGLDLFASHYFGGFFNFW